MPNATPVVFIHGLWIHSDAWGPWLERFQSAGYAPVAPGWPGDSDSVTDTRKNSFAVANKGIDDITSSYAKVIASLPAKPVVIGHSFGGLIAQKLLAGGTPSLASPSTQARSRGSSQSRWPRSAPGCRCFPAPGTRRKQSRSPRSSSATDSAMQSPKQNPASFSTGGPSRVRVSRCSRRPPPTSVRSPPLRSIPRRATGGRCFSLAAAKTTPCPRS